MAKLRSRKLWVTVLTAALVTLSEQLGLDDQTVEQLIYVVAPYLLGQAAVDVAEARGLAK